MKHGMTIRANRYKFVARVYIMLYTVKGRNKIYMVNMNKVFSNFTIYRFKIYAAYLATVPIMR